MSYIFIRKRRVEVLVISLHHTGISQPKYYFKIRRSKFEFHSASQNLQLGHLLCGNAAPLR